MLEEYLKLFEDEVLSLQSLTLEDMVRSMKKEREKILYIDDVSGYSVVANLWAKRERFHKVLGENLINLMLKSIENPTEYDMVEFDMKSEDFSLTDFPVPQYYEGDGGRYFTSAVVFAEYNGKRNASFHRMMILDDKRVAIRLVPRDLYAMHKDAMEHGEEVKIGVAIGLEPNVLLAAATSVDYSMDEMKIASTMRLQALGEKEKMMRLPNGISVPYHAELVLEGKITSEYVEEGPFLDITGTYDIVRKQPVAVFEKFYHRGMPTFHLLLPGGYEHYNLMGLPREPTIYGEIKREGINVLDVRLTYGGCSWLHAVIKIKKKSEEDGKKAIMAAFRGHRSLKHVIVVDDDIDIGNIEEVEWALATRFQGDRDLIKIEHARGSSLDPSSYGDEHFTTKLGFDATAPLFRREKFKRIR